MCFWSTFPFFFLVVFPKDGFFHCWTHWRTKVSLIMISFSWIFNSQLGTFPLYQMKKKNTFFPIHVKICYSNKIANKSGWNASFLSMRARIPELIKWLLVLYWTLFFAAFHLLRGVSPPQIRFLMCTVHGQWLKSFTFEFIVVHWCGEKAIWIWKAFAVHHIDLKNCGMKR